MKKRLLTLMSLAVGLTAVAQNPIITNQFTADPTARVHDGRLFLYPSGDKVPDEGHVFFDQSAGFCMPGYHAFSLKGGSTWINHGWVLKENDVPWGMKDVCAMWAPDCIEKDGKYYYYYPAKALNDDRYRRIGVGVADKPEGPFKWEESYIEGMFGIDPGILVDDDNQAYIFVKSGDAIRVAPLSDDMKSIEHELVDVEGLPAGYKEGPFPIKIGDRYYLVFAHNLAEQGYTIGYAIAKSPMGPYLYYGNIMDCIGKDTNHSSIVKYNDRWIFFYHTWQLSGHSKLRSVCAEYMTFNEDGTINKVTPTLRGIGAPMPGDTIQIDRYNHIEDASIAFVGGNEPAGWMVCETAYNSHVIFNDVDFVDGSSKRMQARVACGQRGGVIEVRKNSANGELIAKFDVKHTGGWNSWETIECDILTPIKGNNNICVVFKGAAKVANLNWLLVLPN